MSNNLPTGFLEGGLYCFPIGLPQDAHYACIPAAPSVEMVDAKPRAALLTSPAGAMLTLQAVWQADEPGLAAARTAIAARHPDGAKVRLAGAELTGVTATLAVQDSGLQRQAFGPRPASGTAANRAVFSEPLTAAEKEAALRAFGGKPGILTLAYAGTLQLSESARAAISGDLAPVVRALAPKPPEKSGGGFFGGLGRHKPPPPPPPAPTLDACAAAVDQAIAGKQLVLTLTETANVSRTARAKASDALRTALASMVLDKIMQMGADAAYLGKLDVNLDKTVPETVSFQLSGSADLGDWAARHGGAGLIQDAGGALPEPRR